jgi:hypothetical protein
MAEECSIVLSTETIRQVLRNAGISWQITKTWKHSKDPDFAAKKDRILDLYDHPPAVLPLSECDQSCSSKVTSLVSRRVALRVGWA